MGILDSALQDVASTLIGTFSSQPATLTRQPVGDYDPRSGETLAPVPISYSVKVSPPSPYKRGEFDETAIKSTDSYVLIAKKDVPIEPDARQDSLTLGGVLFQIVSVEDIGTADADIVYKLQLRR